MTPYIGTKRILAQAMTRGEYNQKRGWQLPENENAADEGYLIEYLDGGTPNHTDHKGYISWSPKDVFEKSYRLYKGMTFGLAIEALLLRHIVARTGWNGKGMYLKLVAPEEYNVGESVSMGGFTEFDLLPWIGMKTADGKFVPWLASQTDILAEDWQVIG